MTMTENELQDGRVVAIAGPVIDVEFPRSALPELNSAIEFTIALEGEETTVLAEVAQQLGDGRVRAICMKPTDGAWWAPRRMRANTASGIDLARN